MVPTNDCHAVLQAARQGEIHQGSSFGVSAGIHQKRVAVDLKSWQKNCCKPFSDGLFCHLENVISSQLKVGNKVYVDKTKENHESVLLEGNSTVFRGFGPAIAVALALTSAATGSMAS